MTTKIKPIVSALAGVAIAISSQGCGRGDNHVKALETAGATDLTSITMDGRAVKGILIHADCIVNDTTGEIYSTVGRSTACTDDKGNYSIYLRKVPKWPIVVTLKGRSGTTMICDNPAGCNGTPFGSQLAVSDISMRAISATPTGRSLSVNVTPYTEMATARALNANGGALGSAINDAAVKKALGETAGIINNLLGLEGTKNALGADFFKVDPGNIAAPSSSLTKQGILMNILSAALLSMDSTKTPQQILDQLTADFKSDGQLNVNAHASNIASADKFDMTTLLSKIAAVANSLGSTLGTAGAKQVNDILGTGTGADSLSLDKIKTDADDLKKQKDAVADANNDPTKPVALTPVTNALSAAKRYTTEVASALAALNGANADSTLLKTYENALEASGDPIDYTTRALLRATAAAEKITVLSSAELTGLDVGCSDNVSTRTCAIGELINLDESQPAGSGNIVWTKSTNTVTASSVNIGGVTINLAMSSTDTPPSNAATDWTETFTATTLNADGGSVSVDLVDTVTTPSATATVYFDHTATPDVLSQTIDTAAGKFNTGSTNFKGDITLSRDKKAGGTYRLSYVNLDGTFSGGSDSIKLAVAFTVDPSTLTTEGTLPEDETSSNFYTVSDLKARITVPTTYTKYDSTTLEPASSTTAENLTFSLEGNRTGYHQGSVDKFRLLTDSGLTAAGSGTLDFAAATGTQTLTFRNANGAAINITGTTTTDNNGKRVTDTTGTITFTGDGTYTSATTSQQGTISDKGTATFTDNTSISAAFILNNNQH